MQLQGHALDDFGPHVDVTCLGIKPRTVVGYDEVGFLVVKEPQAHPDLCGAFF